MHWEHTEEIAAPVDRLWQTTLDIESLPAITPTMTMVGRITSGELAPGSRVRIKQPGQPARVWTVTAVDPLHRFAWETKVGPATMAASHEMAPQGDGSRNTLRIELAGPGSGLLGRFAGRRIAEALATENAGFKRALESV